MKALAATAVATVARRAILGPVVCQYSIAELAGAHLPDFNQLSMFVDLTPAEQDAYRRACSQPGGFHEARRVVALAAARLELAARLAERSLEPGSDERVLILGAEISSARALARRLQVPALTPRDERDERALVLEQLRAGVLRAVVSAGVLDDGLDLLDATVGIVLGGALGTRAQVQRLGALLRTRDGARPVVYELLVREPASPRAP
jgi:superfamily II DNA or RNA helicase